MKRRRRPAWDSASVRGLRQHLELTQEQLADELGVRQQTSASETLNRGINSVFARVYFNCCAGASEMSRLPSLLLLVLVAPLLGGCDPDMAFTVDNRLPSVVCFSTRRAVLECSDVGNEYRIPPGQKIQADFPCHAADWSALVTIHLSTRGSEIWVKSATCGTWRRTGAWATIDQPDGPVRVMDSVTASSK